MDSLIINDRDNEFYLNQDKLYFLENISRINLFIGANNTRKSRFLRKIIETESRAIVSSKPSLNKTYLDSLNLSKEIETQFKESLSENLIVFTNKRRPTESKKRFHDIEAYYESKAIGDRAINFRTIIDSINAVNGTLFRISGGEHIRPLLSEIKLSYAILDFLVYLYELRENISLLSNYLSAGNNWPEDNINAFVFTFPDGRIDRPMSEKLSILKKIRAYFEYLLDLDASVGSNDLTYIPVLRSARKLIMGNNQMILDDVFKHTIHMQYFDGKLPNNGSQIHTAQNFYEEIRKQKGGVNPYRANFKEFEKFIGLSFFQSENLEITALHDENGQKKEVVVDLPGERKDVAIQNLGDGVQAVINLLFPVFAAPKDSWIFIDEPELNLHPGFQNLFIRTLLENEFLKGKNLRYFINSHSNHILSELLLNGTDNSEIYVFNRRDKDSSIVKPFKGYEAATLELLGVLNTSTLLSNCSVWVEGITDRLYIRAYLTAYLKSDDKKIKPIEGLNYTFVEYSGNNLVHYLFEDSTDPMALEEGIKAYFISNKIFLIADTDKGKGKKHQFYKDLKRANFTYYETKYTEIENLIPRQILSKFLQDKLKIEENTANDICRYSYQNIKLGKFLTEKFKKYNITQKIEAKSGTLTSYYKLMLAEYILGGVLNGEITWDMLKENIVLKEIIEELYKFIDRNNK